MSLDKVVERVLQSTPRLMAVILDQLVQAVDHLLLLRQREEGVLSSLPDVFWKVSLFTLAKETTAPPASIGREGGREREEEGGEPRARAVQCHEEVGGGGGGGGGCEVRKLLLLDSVVGRRGRPTLLKPEF